MQSDLAERIHREIHFLLLSKKIKCSECVVAPCVVLLFYLINIA